MFAAIAAIFALGLSQHFAIRFYPLSASLPQRMVAPVVFAVLAAACFAGIGMQVLVLVAAAGLAQMIVSRWQRRKLCVDK